MRRTIAWITPIILLVFVFNSCGGSGDEKEVAMNHVVHYHYPNISEFSSENKMLAASLQDTEAALLQAILLTNSYLYTDPSQTDFSTFRQRGQLAIKAMAILQEHISSTLFYEKESTKIVFSRASAPRIGDELVSPTPWGGKRPIKTLMDKYNISAQKAMDILEESAQQISENAYKEPSTYRAWQEGRKAAWEVVKLGGIAVAGGAAVMAAATPTAVFVSAAGAYIMFTGQTCKTAVALDHWAAAVTETKEIPMPKIFVPVIDAGEIVSIVTMQNSQEVVLYGTDKLLDLANSGGKTVSFGAHDISVYDTAISLQDIQKDLDLSKYPGMEPGVYITPDGKEIKVMNIPIEYGNIISRLKSQDRLIYDCPLAYDASFDPNGDHDIFIGINDKNGDGYFEDYHECTYYASGALEWSIPYTDDKENGITELFYESGQLKEHDISVNDKLNGTSIAYYESGQVAFSVPYVNDKRNGEYREYYESGQLYKKIPYVNGVREGIIYVYYELGALYYKVPYVNDERNGKYREYYESGQLYRKIPYVNGVQEGTVYGYYESGTLNFEIPYVNGQKNGTETYYHTNGDYNLNPWVNGKMNGNAPYYTKTKDGYEMTGCDIYVNDIITGSCMPPPKDESGSITGGV